MTTLAGRYFQYDPEKDYNGAQGIEIADEVVKSLGGDTSKIHSWIKEHEGEKEISDPEKQEYLNYIRRIGRMIEERRQAGFPTSFAVGH